MTIIHQEAAGERAINLQAQGLNGLKFVLVDLYPESEPVEAHLEVHFHNNNLLADILDEFAATPAGQKEAWAKRVFPITGGHRIIAGPGSGQVKALSIAPGLNDESLIITVAPIGDYSTYSLTIDSANIDPFFNEIPFKFRPGCFNLCSPDWQPMPKAQQDPIIDYLAKDYDSFKHTLITAMMARVPGWQATSEADLDQVLIDLFSGAADELSDFQDRVMNEAYLGTARKRVSLARHARLMDYHIHQGNQASTWLALHAAAEETIDTDFQVSVKTAAEAGCRPVFTSRQGDAVAPEQIFSWHIHPLLNDIGLYTWQDAIPALAAGSTSADLLLLRRLPKGGYEPVTDRDSAIIVQNLIRSGEISRLLLEEQLNPATGEEPGRNPQKRQLLRLLPGESGAVAEFDPMTSRWFIHVRWRNEDKLKTNFCFTVNCLGKKVENVSLFHGNLLQVFHGRLWRTLFKEPGAVLASENEVHYLLTEKRNVRCPLPEKWLAYKNTPVGGEIPAESTLEVWVVVSGGVKERWQEVVSFIHSGESDNHFIVETDEDGQSVIVFGNGLNGKELPDGAAVEAVYQTGRGNDGNIGADKLTEFDQLVWGSIEKCWNPFSATNGRDPEAVDSIIRRAPEAYRSRQLRAVTLADYEKRAEEIAGVGRAAASYGWTGSFRTVRLAIDPVGTTELSKELINQVAKHLDAVRLMGEDLEIRPPRFVPLALCVVVCIHSDYWPEDIQDILLQEFSDGYTADGQPGFFHPDQWTFGQMLSSSQIIGRVQAVPGVDHVQGVRMQRFSETGLADFHRAKNGRYCHALQTIGVNEIIEAAHNEILQVHNDWDHLEKGVIFFDIRGGRQ